MNEWNYGCNAIWYELNEWMNEIMVVMCKFEWNECLCLFLEHISRSCCMNCMKCGLSISI